ncbi:MAG: AAA family ATPase [Solirubrobacterales bacterium]|nr:AAA family ATPase [Solirubrobacterales bacterium]
MHYPHNDAPHLHQTQSHADPGGVERYPSGLRDGRQAGRQEHPDWDIAKDEYPAAALSLDNQAARDAASSDPEGFVAGLSRPVLLDEIQRAGPDLLLAIKSVVDADQSPGQFLLTGSANVLTNRKVQDALTGRIEIITLWPLRRRSAADQRCPGRP